MTPRSETSDESGTSRLQHSFPCYTSHSLSSVSFRFLSPSRPPFLTLSPFSLLTRHFWEGGEKRGLKTFFFQVERRRCTFHSPSGNSFTISDKSEERRKERVKVDERISSLHSSCCCFFCRLFFFVFFAVLFKVLKK